MKSFALGKLKPGTIFLTSLLVACFGLIAIYDASIVDAHRTFSDRFHYVRQQATWLAIGCFVSLIVSKIPTSFFKKVAPLLLLGTVFLLILVLIPGIGSKFLGARRWLVFGPIVLQPSEFLKITLVLYLSYWLEKERDVKHFMALMSVLVFLIMLQPDLGTALIVVGVSFLVYYLSGAKIKEIINISIILFISATILILLSPYRLNRVKTFLDPTVDPLGKSYHINQILYGLGSGGFWGVGLGQSRQKYAFLPEATTDSIFVIIAEEFGFVGATLLLSIIVYLITASYRVAQNAKDRFDRLLAGGISTLFLIQFFINLGSMVALIPLTGVPLPFISYGGSSLVTNFIAVGLLINISRKS